MHEHKIIGRYIAEILGAFFLYALVQVLSVNIGHPMPMGMERTLVLLSPVLPGLLIIAAVVRYFRRVDEYVRLIILENWAATAGVTALATFTYGFLEDAGFPRLGMWTVFPLMGTVSALLFIGRRMAGR